MPTKPAIDKLPRYFVVNFELGVKVYEDQGDIVAITHFGTEYPPIKALYEGQEISAEEYDKLFHSKPTIKIPNIVLKGPTL